MQPLRQGKDSTGYYTEYEWHGTPDEVIANIQGIEGSGGLWQIEYSYTGAKTILRARTAQSLIQPEVPIDTWEFFAGEVEKDLFEADVAAINNITDDERRKVRDGIQNPTPGLSPALTSPAAISLYVLMLNGLRAVRVSVPTLRHTQTASTNYSVPNSLANVGRIISTATLRTQESIRADISLNLPNLTSARTGLSYGWFKKHPTIRAAARQKIQIEQEWEYGLWDVSIPLYGALL